MRRLRQYLLLRPWGTQTFKSLRSLAFVGSLPTDNRMSKISHWAAYWSAISLVRYHGSRHWRLTQLQFVFLFLYFIFFTYFFTTDQAGSVLEPLKSDLLHEWIVQAQQNQLDVLVDCLLPWPASYSRVGGSWDTGHCPKSSTIKEGFNRLFCLVPYEIITVDLWNDVIPRWLEAICSTVPSDEWIEFRIILRYFIPNKT